MSNIALQVNILYRLIHLQLYIVKCRHGIIRFTLYTKTFKVISPSIQNESISLSEKHIIYYLYYIYKKKKVTSYSHAVWTLDTFNKVNIHFKKNMISLSGCYMYMHTKSITK